VFLSSLRTARREATVDETLSMWCPDCDGTGFVAPSPLRAALERQAGHTAVPAPHGWPVDCPTCRGHARLTVVLVVAEPERP
jgi:hypothetical protein